MTGDFRITNEDKWRCAEREVKMREHVYPNLVAAGKIRQAAADRQLATMRAIAADYLALCEKERLL